MYYNYEFKKDIDTRDNSPIYVLKITESVNKDVFKKIDQRLREAGFYYSKFKKGYISKVEIDNNKINNLLEKQDKKKYYDIQEIENLSIVDFCESNGIVLKKVGSYFTTEEHDSIRIDPIKNTFQRYSTGTGGNIINFVEEYYNLDFYTAVEKLFDYKGLGVKIDNKTKSLEHTTDSNIIKNHNLDELKANLDEVKDVNRIYAYLIYKRKVDKEIVRDFIYEKLISQDSKGNINFKAYDESGNVIFNQKKGTTDVPFTKIDPNSYSVGFIYENKIETDKKNIYIFESAIDMMSYYSLYKSQIDKNTSILLSMNGLKQNIVLDFLQKEKVENINSIIIATDNDEPGISFANKLQSIIKDRITDNVISHIPNDSKDWNEHLVENTNKLEQKKTLDEIEELNNYCLSLMSNKDKLTEYQNFSQKFLSYSYLNRLRILIQNPRAEFIATENYYNKEGFQVIDKQPIKIVAKHPLYYYRDTRYGIRYIRNVKEKEILEAEGIKVLQTFRYKDIDVYDIKQTNVPLENYPDLSSSKAVIKSNDIDYDMTFKNIINNLIEKDHLKISYKKMPQNILGSCSKIDGEISLNSILKEETPVNSISRLSVFLHEYAHYNLHYKSENENTKIIREYEAELTSFLLMKKLGIEKQLSTYKYLTAYSKEEIKNLLDQSNEKAINILKNVAQASDKIYEKISPCINYIKEKEIKIDNNKDLNIDYKLNIPSYKIEI